MARPKGSENKDKPFRAALQMQLAAAGADLKKLRAIADNLIGLACKAEPSAIQAIREIADRLDGKPTQDIQGEITHTYVAELPQVAPNAEEWRVQNKLQ